MIKMFRKMLFVLLASGLILSTGCVNRSQALSNTEDSKKLSVYTSFYTMYDFAEKIGGDKINLTNIVPSGTEPHDWEPTARDISRLEKADVFIYNGAGMEMWVEKVLNSIDNKKLVVIEASKDIRLIEGKHGDEEESDEEKHEDEEMEYDPHVWLNPIYAKKQMETIKNALVAADPENKDFYEKNYSDNAGKIEALDKEYRDAVAKFIRKDIVVAHEAFGYLCEAYSLNQVAIEGLNADSEPTPARMTEIAKFAKENKVRVIFFEELVSPKVAQAIAKEIGAEVDLLNPIEGISEDELKKGKEYFAVMRDNLAALKKALE